MADIAGLTLAVCDALLKLGERTTQLIQDAKSFNDVGQSNKYEEILIISRHSYTAGCWPIFEQGAQ